MSGMGLIETQVASIVFRSKGALYLVPAVSYIANYGI